MNLYSTAKYSETHYITPPPIFDVRTPYLVPDHKISAHLQNHSEPAPAPKEAGLGHFFDPVFTLITFFHLNR